MKKLPSLNNFWIIAPGLPGACRCDKLEQYPPPPESFKTLNEAIDRLPILFKDVALQTFPKGMPIPKDSISIKITLFDMQKSVTKKEIIKEFKQHPSVPIVGWVYFYETEWTDICCLLQGQKEIQKWLQSQDAKEIIHIVNAIGAKATTLSGITMP